MKNETMNTKAELLAVAGYNETEIEKYFRLLDRKCAHGLDALTINERRFYNNARVAMHKAAATLEAELKAAAKRRVNGKQPVETKLHYRWVEADLGVLVSLTELAYNEVNATAILLEEELRAMRKYQPVLDQIDTSKRGKTNGPIAELLEIAVGLGRRVPIDRTQYLENLKAALPDGGWNPAWERFYLDADRCRVVAAIPESDELEFRALARAEMERVTREIYPSVTVTV